MIKALRVANADYERRIAFFFLDWNDYAGSPIAKKLKVWRQSTLVMLTGNGEAGRLLAQTGEGEIGALLDMAPGRDEGAPPCTG